MTTDKRIELLTQLTASLLATGDFTKPPTKHTQNEEELTLRCYFPDCDGYSGPPLAVLLAETMLISIELAAENFECEPA